MNDKNEVVVPGNQLARSMLNESEKERYADMLREREDARFALMTAREGKEETSKLEEQIATLDAQILEHKKK